MRRVPVVWFVALALAMSLIGTLVTPVRAALITVAPGAVAIAADGTCSLREAIQNANGDAAVNADCAAGAGPDVIQLAPGSTYSISDVFDTSYGPTGLPLIISPITLDGRGATIARTGAAPAFRLLAVEAQNSLTVQDLVLSGGLAQGGDGGSGEPSDDGGGGGGGAGLGGAIFNRGTLIVERSTFTANAAQGGLGGLGAGGGGPDNGGGGGGGGLGGDGGFGGGDGAGGGGGAGGNGGSQTGAANGGGGGGGSITSGADTADGNGGAGGSLNGGGGGGGNGDGAAGGPGGGGGGGGDEGDGGAGGFGGGGGGSGENDSANACTGPHLGGVGGFGGGGGGGGEDALGGAGGFGGGGGGTSSSTSSCTPAGGVGGQFAGDGSGGDQTISPRVSGGGGGGAGLGGALFNAEGVVTLVNSTFSGNSAAGGAGGGPVGGEGEAGSGAGGALFSLNGLLTITNGTFSGNAATLGGGIYHFEENFVGSALVLQSTIVVDSTGMGDCVLNAVSVTTVGSASNLVEANSGCPAVTVTADPALAALALNAPGLTPTMAIALTSPAHDAGSACATTDQRGVARPQGVACDIGAFEVVEATGATPAPTPTPTPSPTPSAQQLPNTRTGEAAPLESGAPALAVLLAAVSASALIAARRRAMKAR